jgi:hypothetical protein
MDGLVDKGLLTSGYELVDIDDCCKLDSTVPNPDSVTLHEAILTFPRPRIGICQHFSAAMPIIRNLDVAIESQ